MAQSAGSERCLDLHEAVAAYSAEMESGIEDASFRDCCWLLEGKKAELEKLVHACWSRHGLVTWTESESFSSVVTATVHISFACPVSEVTFYLMGTVKNQQLLTSLSCTSEWFWVDFQNSDDHSCQPARSCSASCNSILTDAGSERPQSQNSLIPELGRAQSFYYLYSIKLYSSKYQ